jgi:hypothetical protein
MKMAEFDWNVLCGRLAMLLASRGCTKLKIEIEDEIRVKAVEVSPELHLTATAIVTSLRSLLRYEAKSSKNPNKTEVVSAYLQKLGWNVEQMLVNPS